MPTINDDKPDYSFLEVFKNIVDAYRDKDAIVTQGKDRVTYGQLFSKACRTAKLIQAAGIEEGEPVGIGISKSAAYIASMLGTWIAGAAFVPIDPVLPKERAQFIINQAKIRLALVSHDGAASLASLGVRTLPVDNDWSDDGGFAKLAREKIDYVPKRLAYIIYTSGSTGRPKGVMVSHAGIWNFLSQQIEAFQFEPGSRSLFVLSTNFDASVSDIGCALLAGSTLFIEPPGLLAPGPHFMDLLKEREITHMDVPPSLLKTMSCDQAPSSLKTIVIGGEACAPDVVRSWARKCLVVNVYGPTEATVCTSLGACDAQTWERPLIGQPLRNVEYIILDEKAQPVPDGTAGELYISGIQLAIGYVDEPQLTAKKFLTLNGKRYYRTGDLIVRCSDGEYQFLGRVDRQFKLRGMLVEPEEIEARLAAHVDIARAGVLKRPLRQGGPGEKLVAFIQAKDGKAIDPGELKRHLSKSLPLWMVPQIFEFVETMPLTVTGKVDLSHLREVPLKAAPGSEFTVSAQTATQKLLVEVWRQIFALEFVGIHDDFFELGGDSLNVIEAVLAAHLRGLTISPDMLVAHSTIYDLSQKIDEARASEASTEYLAENALSSQFLRQDIQAANGKDTSSTNRQEVNSRKPRNIFMTGSTGFLGSRVLLEILEKTNCTIFCHVRAGTAEAGMKRILHAAEQHGSSLSEEQRKRILPVLGDLTSRNLGLSEPAWRELADKVDTVFHSAATVNMVKDYFELKAANVDGTREISRFLKQGCKKHLHYASTLSVFVATDRNSGIAREDDALDGEFQVYGGYAQTKFAAELLLRSVSADTGPITFYRFGLLTGDSKTGASAKDDFLNMFARGLSTLGCVPESECEMTVDITPVDYAAAAMAHIALQDTKTGISNTYHIANSRGLSLRSLIEVMGRIGFPLAVLPAEEFLARLQNKAQKFSAEESAACLALCRALGSKDSFGQFRTMDLFQATGITFDSTHTAAALQGTSIACPAPSNDLIELYLRRALAFREPNNPARRSDDKRSRELRNTQNS